MIVMKRMTCYENTEFSSYNYYWLIGVYSISEEVF